MTEPRTTSHGRRATAGDDRSDLLGTEISDGDPAALQRRAPLSGNPPVGARGQWARQRILDAALQVFGEEGYHQCGIIRITEVAGCSRVAFYQYFSSKEDVFRHLAARVARQLSVSADALGPLGPDAAGWESVHAWVGRQADIYERYQPVFLAFQAAAESDEALASDSVRIQQRHVAMIRAELTTTSLPSRHLDAVIALLVDCIIRTRHFVGVLRVAMPAGAFPTNRIDTALTDLVHRTLFGLDADVNVHPPARRPPPRLPMGPVLLDGLQADDRTAELGPTAARTRAALLDAADDVLVARGYHGTRVDDIAAAAGVSHGTFYRYFDNKEQVVRLLAMRAMLKVSAALAEIPDVAGEPPTASGALRQWLRRYSATQSAETAMIRVWIDASAADPGLQRASAATVDWGRRRLVRFLAPRGFGDVETEALLLVALLDAFSARGPSPEAVDAATHIIGRGLLGHP